MQKVIFSLVFSAIFLFAQEFYQGPVPYYGRMVASGNRLVGENTGTPVQVRGMSFFWSCIDWDEGKYAKFWTAATVDAMVDGWKVELLRAAMAADNNGGCGDYQGKKTETLQMVKTVVDRAIERDIYVIVDWHSHQAHQQQTAAIDFFVNEMAAYHNVPNVIFEIYNEPPDGDANQWATIKPYQQAVVTAIRNAGANNLILIGTPYYDQNPELATASPLTGNDLAYVLHFYAHEHTLDAATIGRWRFNDESKTFRNVALKALETHPLFVSEWGTVYASGGGAVSVTESDKWHAFMDEHKISSANWSINNKDEGASAFVPSFNVPTTGNAAAWTNTSNMTASGKYIYEKLVGYAATAEWRTATVPISFKPNTATNKIFAVNNGVNLQISSNEVVKVYNIAGKGVLYAPLPAGTHNVSLNHLPRGLYIVKINNEVLRVPVR